MPEASTPVLFIHGLWLHASSWQPWADLFAERGYAPSIAGWPGDGDTVEQSRLNPEAIAGHGIDDVTAHLKTVIDALPSRPILIGHSFGGMLAEKLLGEDYAVAAVGIDAAQIKGVLPLPVSALRATLPAFRNPANRHRAVSLTAAQFRFAFGNAISEEESDELYARWTIPAPGKPLFEAAAANFTPHSPAAVNTGNEGRGPLLLVMGGRDHTVPEAVTRSSFKQYRHSSAVTDLLGLEDRGHSLTIDSGWREVADDVHALLERLGRSQDIDLVGHDIGTMVAYAYAATYRGSVDRLALTEAPIPDETVYGYPSLTKDGPGFWNFGFFSLRNGLPENTIEGHEETWVAGFMDWLTVNKPAITREDTDAYAAALHDDAHLKASFEWFRAFPTDNQDVERLGRKKLTIPVLAVGAESSLGESVGDQAEHYARHVKTAVIKNSGHWIWEEQPAATTTLLLDFLQP